VSPTLVSTNREPPCACTELEGIGYLVRTVSRGRSNTVVILQRQKVMGCVQFTGQGVISQKPNDTCKKKNAPSGP